MLGGHAIEREIKLLLVSLIIDALPHLLEK